MMTMIRVSRSIEKIFLTGAFLRSSMTLGTTFHVHFGDVGQKRAPPPTRGASTATATATATAMRRGMRAHVVALRFVRSRAVRCEESTRTVVASASRRRRDDPPPA